MMCSIDTLVLGSARASEFVRYLERAGPVPLAPRVWLRRQSKSHKNYLSSTEYWITVPPNLSLPSASQHDI